MITRSHLDTSPSPSNETEVWGKLNKMSIIIIPIFLLLCYMTFKDVLKKEKPKTEENKQQKIIPANEQ